MRKSVTTQGDGDCNQRLRAEDASKESEQTFRHIFHSTSDGIIVADTRSKNFQLGNRSICEMLGYDQEKLNDLGVSDIHPKRDLPYVLEQFEKMSRGELKIAKDIPVKRSDGSVFYADINSFEIELDGKTHLVGVFRDVSERRRAEEKLKKSEEKFRLAMEVTNDALWDWDMVTDTVYRNPRHATMLGYEPDELSDSQEEWLKRIHPDDRPSLLGLVKEYLSGRTETFEIEYRLRTKLGDYMWVLGRGRIVAYNDEGSPSRMVGTNIDITGRKRTEAALRESEERYRAIVESAGESIASIDEDGVFLFMNTTGAERLGGKPEDYVGKTMWDVFPEETADRQIAGVREVIRTGKAMVIVMPTVVRGESRWHDTNIEPVKDARGEVQYAMIIAKDIHERKQAEEDLEKYRGEMSRLENLASLGTLSATVAHELTQPLTVVQLSIENAIDELQETSYPETVREGLRVSLIELSHTNDIIDRFRRFARRVSEPIIGEVDLHIVGERIIKLLSRAAEQANTTLLLQDMSGLPHIEGNEKDFDQAFFGLIHNAITAGGTARSRKVVVSGQVRDGHIELSFSDTSGGISKANLKRIFEPFFTTKPPGKGTGLGLCVVQDIVERAGGKISVESRSGKGSTFYVRLPIRT